MPTSGARNSVAVDDMTRLSVGELESSTATDFMFWIVVLLQLEAWK